LEARRSEAHHTPGKEQGGRPAAGASRILAQIVVTGVKRWDLPVDRKDVPVETVVQAFEALVPLDLEAEPQAKGESPSIQGIMVEAPDDMPVGLVRHYFREALKNAGSKATEGLPRECRYS
jgi:hypothetical protein